jgi:lysyl-tRNA synthetase class II
MYRMIAAAVAVGSLFAGPALALDAKVEAAVKTFAAIEQDAAKVQAYCDMSKTMEDVGDDEKKLEAANAKIDDYFKTLGPDFETAWNTGENLKEDSDDAKALSDALDKLDAKCGPPADAAGEAAPDAGQDAPKP